MNKNNSKFTSASPYLHDIIVCYRNIFTFTDSNISVVTELLYVVSRSDETHSVSLRNLFCTREFLGKLQFLVLQMLTNIFPEVTLPCGFSWDRKLAFSGILSARYAAQWTPQTSVFIGTSFSVKYFHRPFLELLNNPSFFMLTLF